jgi:hypothetical protein
MNSEMCSLVLSKATDLITKVDVVRHIVNQKKGQTWL